ncbi:MAG: SSU ribosomal protein S9p (S16e) [Olavius algarvensis Delta 4 endosymbiont]|nr:MAG: SSU ribosomal protein S9p (S16e) [Olavius algarvensis Delta 4 endosymbiont]
MDNQNTFYATGKRKSAIAKTWLTPGNGQITVNKKPLDEYFRVETAKMLLAQPFAITNTSGEYDVKVKVLGGGVTGQANAIRHGITKALILVNPDYRGPLKKAGFVKRDPRVKERKKYGQKGARARFQFSKR